MADKNEISESLIRVISKLDGNLYEAMTEACAVVRNDAVKNAPHGTGALQRSIDFEVENNGTRGVVYSNLEYAPYVEAGTGKYATVGQGRDTPWSYPYYSKGGEKWATTEGREATPFLRPALEQNTTKIRECFKGVLVDEKL